MPVPIAIPVSASSVVACAGDAGPKAHAKRAHTSSVWTDVAQLYRALFNAEPQVGTYRLRLGTFLRANAHEREESAARMKKKTATSGAL